MTEPVKILCVDDERNVLRALQRLFLDEDYTILSALSGEEGLEILAREEGIQLVISDYRMPGMNGVAFLKKVCARWPETVRMVLSGYADTAAIVGAINEGQIYKFIPKPWNDDDLMVTVGNALERYFLQQENRLLMEKLQQSNAELQSMNDNLEDLVLKRTRDLTRHTNTLICTQNIMDALPMAVIGLDRRDQVVFCNDMAGDLLNPDGDNFLIGNHRRGCLPDALNAFVDQITDSTCVKGILRFAGRMLEAKGVHMSHPDQEGIIVVLEPEREIEYS